MANVFPGRIGIIIARFLLRNIEMMVLIVLQGKAKQEESGNERL
jgi:hypothetical protein